MATALLALTALTAPAVSQATTYGAGCGSPAMWLVPNPSQPAYIGGVATGAVLFAPSSFVSVSFGLSDTSFGGAALPLALGPFGMPGCELLHSAEVFGIAAVPAGGNTLTFSMPIGGQAWFIGTHVYAQAFAYAPGVNAAEVIASNGIDWTVLCAPLGGITIVEDFSDDSQQDALVSGGVWGGASGAGARPGLVGGDGRHGSFDHTLGTSIGGGVYEWSTENFVIPATSSSTGLQYTVTNGEFFFTDMVVPAGVTVRFVGSVPPVIRVRGQVDIQGTIDVNGENAPGEVAYGSPNGSNQLGQIVSTFSATLNAAGQPGSSGGPGGGKGGAGGDRCLNAGPIIVGGINVTNGQPGDDVQVGAGHAYLGAAQGTGGLGSELTPSTGVWASPVPTLQGVWCSYFSPGGGGGGFHGPGNAASSAMYVGNATIGSLTPGLPAGGGAGFSLMPFPPVAAPPGYSSLEHFTVGGSGGGGGGSHGYGVVAVGVINNRFLSGHGGTGGGGAVAIRSGGSMHVAGGAVLSARGGDGVLVTGTPAAGSPQNVLGVSSPGGGGSGGSYLLQSGRSVAIDGEINSRGGIGSRVGEVATSQLRVNAPAGDGANGFFRLEAPAGGVAFSGTSTPAFDASENVGVLNDRDDRTGDTSLWYTTNLTAPATWSHYELDVDLDGDGTVDVTYTDTGAAGTQLAAEPGGPVTLPLTIQFQGVFLYSNGQPISPPGPWRDGIGSGAGPGIHLDFANGYRFRTTYNRALFPDLVVKELRVFYSGC